MSEEVRDMIAKALQGEPPMGLDYDAVRTGGRRRRARRHAGIAAAAALGVVAVASTAVTVGQLGAGPADDPLRPATSTPASPSVSCADLPVPPGAVGAAPPADVPPERARQAASLNEGFSRTGLPLPAGVSADPVRPPLCPNGGAWVTRVTLHGPAGDRGLFLSVLPWVEPAFTDCTGYTPAGCRVVKLADGTGIRIIETSAVKPTGAVRVQVDAWRPDGVGISVLETGADGPKPAPRILADEELIRLVSGTVPVLPPLDAPAPDVATRLTALLAKEWTLPEGLRPAPVPGATVPPLTFHAANGAYLLAADLVDDAGVGNLYIDLKPRRAAPFTPACDPGTCRLLRLPDGRPAALATQTGGAVVQYVLSTLAPSGAEIQIISRNKSAHADRQPGATRDLPPLSETDLIKIATGPGAYW